MTNEKCQISNLKLLLDPASANHDIVIIKNRGLARSDGRLRRIKLDSHAMAFNRMNRSRRLTGSISNSNVGSQWSLRRRDRHPVHPRRHKFVFIQLVFAANHQLISRNINLHHVKRFARGNADASSLTDGKVVQSVVLTDRSTVEGLYLSARGARFTHFVTRIVFYKS